MTREHDRTTESWRPHGRRREPAELVDDNALLTAMLATEVALAEAQAELGVIPAGAAKAIRIAAVPACIDLEAVAEGVRETANPVVSLVEQLTAAVRSVDASAAEYVHRGSTSQDILDTAADAAVRGDAGPHRRRPTGMRRESGRTRRTTPRHTDGRAHPDPARRAGHLRAEGGDLAAPGARRRGAGAPDPRGAARLGGRRGGHPRRVPPVRGRHRRPGRRDAALARAGGPSPRAWPSRSFPGTAFARPWPTSPRA